MNNLIHDFVTVNNIRMHIVTSGPTNGSLAVLLHGFPECWYSWRHQIPVLAEAGYCVVAPDQRGYNTTDKTPPYDILTFITDIVALIEHFGRDKATIIGHDWGGAVAWYLATRRADMVENLVILNVPHGLAFQKTLRSSPKQMLKSWYIFAFQLKMMDWLLQTNNFKFMETIFLRSAKSGVFESDIAIYKEAWSQPGAIPAMIGWYRTMFNTARRSNRGGTRAQVNLPVLLIWGDADRYMGVEMAKMSRRWAPNLRLEILPGVSHWIQQEAPEEVNRLILTYLKESEA